MDYPWSQDNFKKELENIANMEPRVGSLLVTVRQCCELNLMSYGGKPPCSPEYSFVMSFDAQNPLQAKVVVA